MLCDNLWIPWIHPTGSNCNVLDWVSGQCCVSLVYLAPLCCNLFQWWWSCDQLLDCFPMVKIAKMDSQFSHHRIGRHALGSHCIQCSQWPPLSPACEGNLLVWGGKRRAGHTYLVLQLLIYAVRFSVCHWYKISQALAKSGSNQGIFLESVVKRSISYARKWSI